MDRELKSEDKLVKSAVEGNQRDHLILEKDLSSVTSLSSSRNLKIVLNRGVNVRREL